MRLSRIIHFLCFASKAYTWHGRDAPNAANAPPNFAPEFLAQMANTSRELAPTGLFSVAPDASVARADAGDNASVVSQASTLTSYPMAGPPGGMFMTPPTGMFMTPPPRSAVCAYPPCNNEVAPDSRFCASCTMIKKGLDAA